MDGKRILLVEDNPVNRRLAQFLLKSKGYEVWEATTAPEAFAVLKEHRPDLILMDIQASNRTIRATPSRRRAPFGRVRRVSSRPVPPWHAQGIALYCGSPDEAARAPRPRGDMMAEGYARVVVLTGGFAA